jgi:iron complex outermembrane receptor protein
LRLACSPNPRLELSIVGQNVLHARHAEFGSSASRQYVERSVFGKILCHF